MNHSADRDADRDRLQMLQIMSSTVQIFTFDTLLKSVGMLTKEKEKAHELHTS